MHADADPVDPRCGIRAHHVDGDVVGIALDRDLCSSSQRNDRQDCGEIGGGTRVGVPPPTNTLDTGQEIARVDVAAQGVEVVADHMVAIGPGGKRAVVAAVPAERDVDVDAERLRRGGESLHRTVQQVERIEALTDLVDRHVEHR